MEACVLIKCQFPIEVQGSNVINSSAVDDILIYFCKYFKTE